MINEENYTDTLRNIEELYRCGAIDQDKYLELRKAILFKDKRKINLKINNYV